MTETTVNTMAMTMPARPTRANLLGKARRVGILWTTLLLFVVLALSTDGFLTVANMRNVLDQQATLLIAASFATISLIAGAFDVSAASVFVVAPLFALRVENETGSIPLAILAGLGVGMFVGLCNGVIVAVFKINAFIATLATSFMVFGSGYLISSRRILKPHDLDYADLARSRWLGLTSATWVALAVVVVAWVVLSASRFGRHVYAAGGNPEAARLAGVRVNGVVAITFVLAGLAAALAGVMSSSRSISAQPSDDFSFVFGVISAIVVGGTSIAGGEGAVWRTALGALFVAFMVNGFNLHQIDPIWQRVIQGAVILIAVGVDAWSRRTRSS
jgi:ribose transport system permease protein